MAMAMKDKSSGKFVVVDCDFNRAWYPKLIGQVFANPPSYVIVREVDHEK